MRALTLEELDIVSGGRGLRQQFDSCSDPDGSDMEGYFLGLEHADDPDGDELYSIWLTQNDPSAQRHQVGPTEVLSVHLSTLASGKGSTPAEARAQSLTCQIDPLFRNMMSSPEFGQVLAKLVTSSKYNFYEYATNFYGSSDFGNPYTRRSYDSVTLWEGSLWNLFYGRADVVIHTHPAPDSRAGLSTKSGDIDTANRMNIGIMAIDMSALPPGSRDYSLLKYYCYNPSK